MATKKPRTLSRAWLRASRRRWRRKLRWREDQLIVARKSRDKARIAKWEHLTEEARRNILIRDKQLAESRPMRLRALDEAKKLIGVMEEGGNNMGRKVLEIIRANGGFGPEPWCGDFVAYVYRRAGSKVVTRAWASVWWLGRVAGLRTVSADNVEAGDIVRFSFSHTGLFVKWIDRGAGVFESIEGNTGSTGAVSDSATGGDGVYRKRRNLNQVTDFRRVTR